MKVQRDERRLKCLAGQLKCSRWKRREFSLMQRRSSYSQRRPICSLFFTPSLAWALTGMFELDPTELFSTKWLLICLDSAVNTISECQASTFKWHFALPLEFATRLYCLWYCCGINGILFVVSAQLHDGRVPPAHATCQVSLVSKSNVNIWELTLKNTSSEVLLESIKERGNLQVYINHAV